MKLVKTNNVDYCRDENNTALINTNVTAFNQYKQRVKDKSEINDMKKEMEQLKALITKLVN